MNGVIGAISLVNVSSTCVSVAKADAPSGLDGPSQNLRRDLRTYQFDMSSINEASRRPAAAESKASIAAVTSRTTKFSSLSSQRSSGARSAGAGAAACTATSAGTAAPAGTSASAASAALAYKIRNEAVFQ